jgi:hypothetical protein
MSSLFEINNLPEPTNVKLKSASKKVVQREIRTSKAEQTALEVIGKVEMGSTIHFVSACDWSCIDMLNVILDQIGPAEVTIATWSVSEDATRSLIESCRTGRITRLSTIFDWRIKVRRPEVFELAKFNIANIKLSTCHAKTTVIQNEKYQIALVGSANYTTNPRIETGFICCNKEVAEFHKSWMDEELANADPFNTHKRNKKG